MGPAVVTISSTSEAEPLLTSDATIAVAYLENPKVSPVYFQSILKQGRNEMFCAC
jgi:hypothetical protein